MTRHCAFKSLGGVSVWCSLVSCPYGLSTQPLEAHANYRLLRLTVGRFPSQPGADVSRPNEEHQPSLHLSNAAPDKRQNRGESSLPGLQLWTWIVTSTQMVL